MKIRNFTAANMALALAQVKEELGPDAVIFSTRDVKKSLMAGSQVEVTAAIDEDRSALPGVPIGTAGMLSIHAQSRPVERLAAGDKTGGGAGGKAGAKPLSLGGGRASKAYGGTSKKSSKKRTSRRSPVLQSSSQYSTKAVPDMAHTSSAPSTEMLDYTVEDRLTALRKEVRQLRNELRDERAEGGAEVISAQLGDIRQMLRLQSQELHGWAQQLLTFANVNHAAQKEVVSHLDNNPPPDNHSERVALLTDAVSLTLHERTGDVAQSALQDRLVALVGPTGVGKTTTLAKLAAHACFERDQQVALITLDTFRVGAVDQLQHYARLIGIPCMVAKDSKEFAQALHKFSDCDKVFIDTAGRNLRDTRQVPRLAALFQEFGIAVHLTLAASTGLFENHDITERFRPLNPKSLVLTKFDEARSFGAVLNSFSAPAMGLSHLHQQHALQAAPLQAPLPIGYVTTGQRVPEDMLVPSADWLAHRLVQGANGCLNEAI